VYDVFARSLKRSRVVITIDFSSFAKKKSRVDVQKRALFEIAFDSKFEMKKKKMKEKKIATKKIVKEEKKKKKKRRC
jgi:ABC-type Na+ efflux pump permease subunit